jgi:hypothetical protein
MHRPDPDRVDELGFTTREVGQLIRRSPERVRELCATCEGFAVRAPDGSWRIRPINALVAFALVQENRKLGVKEFSRRTANGMRGLRTLAQIIADDPGIKRQVFAILESKLAGWWERHRYRADPPEERASVREVADAG